MSSFESYKYDIVMVAGHLWLYDFVKNGSIKEIGEYSDNYDYQDILQTIRDEIEIDGKKYLFPFFCDGHMLLYRKSVFGDNLKDTVDIDELIDLVSHSRVDNSNVFTLKAHVSEIFQDMLPYFRSEGVEPFDAEGNTYFNNPLGLVALEKYISLKKYCDSGVQNFGNEEVLDQIQKGKCKIGVTWSGQIGQVMNDDCIDSDDIEFASLDTSWNVTWCFGINKFCKDDESAQIFLEYITGKDVDKRVGYYCGNPVRLSSFEAGIDDNKWLSLIHI
jgi:multiple sugar transport system substrate-binding protein